LRTPARAGLAGSVVLVARGDRDLLVL